MKVNLKKQPKIKDENSQKRTNALIYEGFVLFFLYSIRVSKACIFFSTCQIAQFKATICRWCPCQPSTTDTSISPILLRRLLANVSANSLRSNSAPTFALTHKIGQKSPIVCLCLSGTDTICKLLSYCCAIWQVQFRLCAFDTLIFIGKFVL